MSRIVYDAQDMHSIVSPFFHLASIWPMGPVWIAESGVGSCFLGCFKAAAAAAGQDLFIYSVATRGKHGQTTAGAAFLACSASIDPVDKL